MGDSLLTDVDRAITVAAAAREEKRGDRERCDISVQ